jgi:hypothetical protein
MCSLRECRAAHELLGTLPVPSEGSSWADWIPPVNKVRAPHHFLRGT